MVQVLEQADIARETVLPMQNLTPAYVLAIVIPFYNANATLGRTLDSLQVIASESKHRVQLVLIDDGSTDGSATTAREWATMQRPNFGKIELIYKVNGGTSSARNRGLLTGSTCLTPTTN